MTYWNTLFKKFRWIKLIKEIHTFGKVKHLGRRFLYRQILKEYWQTLKGKFLAFKNREFGISNKELASKWHSFRRIKRKGYGKQDDYLYDYKRQNGTITNLILLSHIGCMETNTSLADGLLRRDPTRDKRVIEFCMSLPKEQYIHEGKGRSLIRRAMKGEVPDRIRLNYTVRGRQAADWMQRLVPYQESIVKEVESIIENQQLTRFFDKEIIVHNLNTLKQGIHKDMDEKELRQLLYVIVFSRFMKQYQMG